MSNLDTKKLLDYTYSRLPDYYIRKDLEIDEERPPLYNFLQAMFMPPPSGMGSGAVDYVVDKANKFVDLTDPESCPADAFPKLLESFGYDYNSLIETKMVDGKPIVYYHRKLLMNIGELTKRRGTMSAVRFMARILTGLEVGDYKYWRGYRKDNEGNNVYGRWLDLVLQANTVEQVMGLRHGVRIIEEFIHLVLPHYINVRVSYEVDNVIIEFNKESAPHLGTAVSIHQHTDFTKKGE